MAFGFTQVTTVIPVSRSITISSAFPMKLQSPKRPTMNRRYTLILLVFLHFVSAGHGNETGRANEQPMLPANHGPGGLCKTVHLTEMEGFDKVRTISDLARFASTVPGAVGFISHPGFGDEDRDAHAVLWYTSLCPTNQSWPLYLFEEREAMKKPGKVPTDFALGAAEAAVSAKLESAQKLIDAGGQDGVVLPGNPLTVQSAEEEDVLACAVIRLGGFFKHDGKFGVLCGGCRSVVPGGTPRQCGLGLKAQKHWSCCGAGEQEKRCRSWGLRFAHEEAARNGAARPAPKPEGVEKRKSQTEE